MTEDEMMQENGNDVTWESIKRPFKYIEIVDFGGENVFRRCTLCGKFFLYDDMDEEYPDCCKSCVEATSDLEGEV